jgi:hypothetical protein
MWYKKRRNFKTFCISAAIILSCVIGLKISHGPLIFRRYVCKPIPKSVKNIKVHRPWETGGHRYVMHFKISKDDLQLILNSRRFKEMMDVKYKIKKGILVWQKDPSQGWSLTVYSPSEGRPGPKWFRPDQWDNSKVYFFKDMFGSYQSHWQVLIFNEELAEAYVVEYQEGAW